jgi:hypothetical protein
MHQYLLSICYPAGAGQPAPDALRRIGKDVAAVGDEMRAAGAWVFAAGLHSPDTATVVQARDGDDMLVTDGPFIESKEQIGGFCVVRAADLDAALKWGEKMSRATTTPVEVRPIQPHG